MNQLYAEAGVKRKNDAKTLALKALIGIGVVIGVLFLLLGNLFSMIGAIIIVVLIWFFPRLNLEYEYIFVDGQLDFDRISGKAKRKTMLRIDLEDAEIVAPEGSHALDSYTKQQLIKKDFTSGDKASKPYIIIASVNSKRYWISFEPSEKMLSMMKQKTPRKIVQY
jgi:hypothetical protein